jgi:hypothetical protein
MTGACCTYIDSMIQGRVRPDEERKRSSPTLVTLPGTLDCVYEHPPVQVRALIAPGSSYFAGAWPGPRQNLTSNGACQGLLTGTKGLCGAAFASSRDSRGLIDGAAGGREAPGFIPGRDALRNEAKRGAGAG